jgi:polycystin 1L2
MRQLRVKSRQCQVKEEHSSECEDDYSFYNEDKDSFEPGWNNVTTQVYSSSIQEAFKYKTGDELDSYIYLGKHKKYGSGGYVYEFRGRLSDLQSNLSELHQLEWIDKQTRAVMIQFNLYNPNIQLFTSMTLLTEFLPTGGLDPQSQFQPFSFQREYFLQLSTTSLLSILVFTSISQLICAILYMICIIYMMIEQIQSFLQMKMQYFRQFWSYVDEGIIVCSWTSVGIYVWRYNESNRIGKLFKQTNGHVYVNLQLAVYINNVLMNLISFCCFFGWIKLIRLCRFHRRFLLFIETLKHAEKELISFSLMFSFIFLSFVCLFYLLFISKISTCSTLFSTAEMLFEMTLMKFNAYELIDVSPFLGPFCFSLFIFIVVFICLSMFITIINHSFRFVRDDIKKHQYEDEQVFTFMIQKFRHWIGMTVLFFFSY